MACTLFCQNIENRAIAGAKKEGKCGQHSSFVNSDDEEKHSRGLRIRTKTARGAVMQYAPRKAGLGMGIREIVWSSHDLIA
jgi:hypothetical protein